MHAPKTLAGFFLWALRLLLLFAALMFMWLAPGVARAYAAFYRATASTLFASFGAGGQATFEPLSADLDLKDTRVVCTNRHAPEFADAGLLVSSRYGGYVPTVTLVALVLATPISYRRRAWALLWGLLAVHGFIFLRLAILLLNKFSYDNPIRAVALSSLAKSAVLFVTDSIFSSILASAFAVPALIWVLVTFRRADWQWLAPAPPDVRRDDPRAA